ncbi:MAG: hypothetical protein OHK0013_32520 [Sandaracinaceae bacterium]
MRRAIVSSVCVSSLALALAGCPSDPPPGNDAGPTADAPGGTACPVRGVPNPEQQMGACCYRFSQATQRDAPELRLRSIAIDEPAMSPLASTAVETVLNTGLTEETFNWLFRTTGADDDGPVEITTGYGVRESDGTYTLGSAEYPPITLTGTLSGETVSTDTVLGPLNIPVFDESGMNLQFVLSLRSIRVIDVTFSEDRSCIGRLTGRTFEPAGSLEGFITVADAQAGSINVPPIMSSLCSVIAGELSTPAGMMPLCDRPRSEWMARPDSLCDASGCMANPAGSTSVCDPLTTCNAWRLFARFAAVGVDIR